MRRWSAGVTLALFPALDLLAQAPTLQFDTVYECPPVRARMTVYSCAGPAPGDSCDVRTEPDNRPPMRGKAPRQQVMALLQMCHVQTQAEVRAAAQGGPPRAAVAAPEVLGGEPEPANQRPAAQLDISFL